LIDLQLSKLKGTHSMEPDNYILSANPF